MKNSTCLSLVVVVTIFALSACSKNVSVRSDQSNTDGLPVYAKVSDKKTRCDSLNVWLSKINTMAGEDIFKNDLSAIDFSLQSGKRMKYGVKGFADEVFVTTFGESYFDLGEKQRKTIARDLKRCYGKNAGVMDITQAFEPKKGGPNLNAIRRWWAWKKGIQQERDEIVRQARAKKIKINRAYILNKAGDLLYTGEGFKIYKRAANNQRKSEWCKYTQFKVSVVFDVDRDHVFSREFIYNSLYKSVLPDLRKQYCSSTTSIFSFHYLKNIFIDIYGGEYSIEEASVSSIKNREISTSSYYTSSGNPLIGNIRFHYTGSDLASYDKYYDEYVSEVGSVAALQKYSARNQIALAEVERRKIESERVKVLLQKSTDRQIAMLKKLKNQYGVSLNNVYFAAILDNNLTILNDIIKSPEDKWSVLRAYILTTTEKCGKKTVGTPVKHQLKLDYLDGRKERSGIYYWLSADLIPFTTGTTWGDSLTGLSKGSDSTQSDVMSLLNKHGCASAPFVNFERNLIKIYL